VSEPNIDQIRRYWDDDAEVYDVSPRHRPTDPAVVAAWTAAVKRTLPPSPARVLDCGAGTGFLSLIAARLGHRVTALDMSAGMLEVLRVKAAGEQLPVEIAVGPAHEPPSGFDAVIERNLLWTLPEPVGTLVAWKEANPTARLASFGGIWGSADPWERLEASARRLAARVRKAPPEHHAHYSADLVASLPLGRGTTPDRVVEVVSAAGWRQPGLERLRDVEWAEALSLGPVERLLGVPARFLVTAEAY
jgi:SAM-dependent methyltransferase